MNSTRKKEAISPAKALFLKDAVAYAKNSVVSKTLFKKRSATLTLFAFDKGQAISEHTVPFDAFVYILDGEAEFSVGKKSVRAKTGDFLLMPADVPHALRAVKKFKMLLIMAKK